MAFGIGGITGFLRSQSGAVSVDWVVLSASVVGIGMAAVVAVTTGAADMGAEVSYTLRAASIAGMAGNEFDAVATVSDLASVAAASAYQPLVATPEELDLLVQHLAGSMDAETLAASYVHYATQTASLISAGEYQAVPGLLDTVLAFEQALQRTGVTLPEGAPGVQDLRAAFDQGNS